jgi:tetratricopeptide (TPR) repeat protein
MKIEFFLSRVLNIPFRKKRSFFLVHAVFLILWTTIFAAAADIQQTDSREARELVKQAEKLRYKGEFAEAEKLLRSVVARYPKDSRAKLELAYILLKRRELQEAFDLSYEIAKAEPKNSYAFAILGRIYLTLGNFKEANNLFLSALQSNRKEGLAWAGLGMLDFYENRIDKSLEHLYEAVYLEPREPDYLFSYAQVSARAEKYKEAAAAYERFLTVSPLTDVERRDRIKGLIKFLRFLGNRKALYIITGENTTSVNVELVNDRPIILLRVNKKDEPLRFVLDTGSGISVISRETAERLNIKPVTKGGLARAIGGAGKFEIVYGFLNSVEIGEVKINNVPVYIREFHNRNERVDGYIGLSLISKFLTTIDYGSRKFSLLKKDSSQDKKTDEKAMLPLRLTSSGFLSGEVELEGVKIPLNFIVDTGASISVISENLADLEEVRQFARDEKMRVVGAAGITEAVPSFMLPRVTFGSNSREQIKAIALDLDIINEASGFEQSGILGGNFLKNYRVTFDFQNSKVTFVPIKEP